MIRSIFQRESSILLLSNPPVNSLAHPIRKNLLMELDRAISRKSKSIIIAGEGKIFSGGADLKEFMKGNHLMEPNLWQMIEYLDTVNIPLTAFVHGAVVGGGFETAIACHWRVATPGARFGLPEVHIGIIPGTNLIGYTFDKEIYAHYKEREVPNDFRDLQDLKNLTK